MKTTAHPSAVRLRIATIGEDLTATTRITTNCISLLVGAHVPPGRHAELIDHARAHAADGPAMWACGDGFCHHWQPHSP